MKTFGSYVKRVRALGWPFLLTGLAFVLGIVALAQPIWMYDQTVAGGDVDRWTYGWSVVTHEQWQNGAWSGTTVTPYTSPSFADFRVRDAVGTSYGVASGEPRPGHRDLRLRRQRRGERTREQRLHPHLGGRGRLVALDGGDAPHGNRVRGAPPPEKAVGPSIARPLGRVLSHFPRRRNKPQIALRGMSPQRRKGRDGMKKFATELRGKTVMTQDGQILGMIENFIIDTHSGKVENVLVVPAEEVEPRLFKTDPQGRIVLPFQGMKAIKDVVVMSVGGT